MNPLSLLSFTRLHSRRPTGAGGASATVSNGAILLLAHPRDALYARQSLAQQLEGAGHRVALQRRQGSPSSYCALLAVASRDFSESPECAAELAEASSSLSANRVAAVLPRGPMEDRKKEVR